MSSPQDPNQGQQPGWGAPQPGWDAPQPPSAPQTPPQTPPTQPGWGPPPPAQPGWGAPQGYPPQPGYPPQQPGYPPQQPGYPPQPGYPGWGQQGWAPQPARSNKKGCLIGLGIFLVIVAVLVGGCVVVIAPIVGTDLKLQQDLGSKAEGVSFNWNNGVSTFVINLAPGQESQAENIACHIIKPDIQSSSTPNAHFVIYSANRAWLADDTTPCS
jgi:hypothetical protein